MPATTDHLSYVVVRKREDRDCGKCNPAQIAEASGSSSHSGGNLHSAVGDGVNKAKLG